MADTPAYAPQLCPTPHDGAYAPDEAANLDHAERRFRELLDRAPIGIAHHRMIYDDEGRAVDYFFLAANKAYKELTGVDPVGKRVTEAFPGIERDPFDWIGLYAEVVATGVEKRFSQYFALNDRYYDCVAFRNAPGCFVVAFNEITEQKRTEAELEREKRLLRTIMDTSPVGIATVDVDGAITYANKRAEEILGLSRDDITNRAYNAPAWKSTTLDGRPLPDEEQPFMVVKRRNAPAYGIRHAIEWPNGRRVILSVNGSPILGPNGEFRGMVATFEDITEQRAAEERIEAMLREKELILKETHHRVKNNLLVAASLLDLEAEQQSDERCSAAIDAAAERVRALMSLYDRLYRSGGEGFRHLDEALPPLLDEIVTLVSSRTRLSLETAIEHVEIPAKDLVTIGIILNELVANSAKYAFGRRTDGRITVSARRDGRELRLRYADDGVGLPTSIGFDESSGFGMRLVGVLAEQLKARAHIERGTGAAFEFVIPLL